MTLKLNDGGWKNYLIGAMTLILAALSGVLADRLSIAKMDASQQTTIQEHTRSLNRLERNEDRFVSQVEFQQFSQRVLNDLEYIKRRLDKSRN